MKEHLISLLISQIGLEKEKAEQAVTIVLNYIKDNPQQLASYLKDVDTSSIPKSLSSLLGR